MSSLTSDSSPSHGCACLGASGKHEAQTRCCGPPGRATRFIYGHTGEGQRLAASVGARGMQLRSHGEYRRSHGEYPGGHVPAAPAAQSSHSVFNLLQAITMTDGSATAGHRRATSASYGTCQACFVPLETSVKTVGFVPLRNVCRFAPFSDSAGAAVPFAASGPLASSGSFRLLAHPNDRVTPHRPRTHTGLVCHQPAPPTCLARCPIPWLGQ
jgi:hypothetical protein